MSKLFELCGKHFGFRYINNNVRSLRLTHNRAEKQRNARINGNMERQLSFSKCLTLTIHIYVAMSVVKYVIHNAQLDQVISFIDYWSQVSQHSKLSSNTL